MLASSSLGEEGVEAVVSSTDGLIRGHLAIRLNAVLQAVELPAGVANLTSGLANMDTATLTLGNSTSQSSQSYISLSLTLSLDN